MKYIRKKDIPHYFERACLSKSNLTEEEANSIIDKRVREDNLVLYYYKCPLCSSIHLTSREPNHETNLEVI
jgi:hypothetical protein